MTEIFKSPVSFSNKFSADKPVLSVKRYEANPPDNISSSQLIDPKYILATTKEEEWVTKKKVELTTKKQIETRVKRQVVLEDGKVVEDSGPIVTTNTTEDTEKQEHEQTEHRKVGDDPPSKGWVTVPNSKGLVKEVCESKVKSREETEELLETEDVQHLGDITDDAYLKAIQSQRKDLRLALRQGSSEILFPTPNGRIINQSRKNRKVVDTENTRHLSEIQVDGKLITETTKTTKHEEVDNVAEPDHESDPDEYETHRESSQRFRKTKDQEFVQYLRDGVKVGEKMKFVAENVEGDRRGDPDSLKIDSIHWECLSERIRRMRREKQQKLEEAERMDALPKKPLNIDQEEQTRKVETSKWLEHHFGSESRSSHSSIDEDRPPRKKETSTSFINVTMKSTKSPAPQLSPSAPPKNALYKGISKWNGSTSRHSITNDINKLNSEPQSPPTTNENVYEVQTGSIKKFLSEDRSHLPFKHEAKKTQTFSSKHFAQRGASPVSELQSSPLYASIQQKYNTGNTSSSYENSSSYAEKTVKGEGTHNGLLRSTPTNSQYRNHNGFKKTESNRPKRTSSMITRGFMNSLQSQSERRLNNITDFEVQREPDPDYTPKLRKRVPSSPDICSIPATDITSKKVYQKTRFSAEIPLIKRTKPTTVRVQRRASSFGDTFRKIIGRFQGGSKKKAHNSNGKESCVNGILQSEESQQQYNSYQAYNTVDNYITDTDDADEVRVNKNDWNMQSQIKKPVVRYASSSEDQTSLRKNITASTPSLNTQRSMLSNASQTLDRDYRSRKHRLYDDTPKRSSPPQAKYYLGEDPFSGSIYGKEKEYNGLIPMRRKYKNGNSTDDEKRSVKSQIMNGVHSLLGGRRTKSVNKLPPKSNERSPRIYVKYTDRGIQTLPRKSNKQVLNEPHSDKENLHSRRPPNHHNSKSMINISTINNRPSHSFRTHDSMGPQKPAGNYRSSLLRSKSFNVQLGPNHGHESTYKSNPQLNKLEESPQPLKSPGIVTNIDRSTRDLSTSFAVDFKYAKPNGYSYNFSKLPSSRRLKSSLQEDRKLNVSPKVCPLVYSTPKHKVLDYSNSFHIGSTRKPTVSFESDYQLPPSNKSHTSSSGRSPDQTDDGMNRTTSRNGNSDDYFETVNKSSKSRYPLRPNITNTTKSSFKNSTPFRDSYTKSA